jgi:hypothetical protein
MSIPDGPAGQLLSFAGARGLRLDGILYRGIGARTTVIHAHGSFGNFYQNGFVRVLAKHVQSAGANFLAFNLSAHDGVAEGYYSDGSFRYVGASLVDFETCIDDLAGAVNLSRGLTDKIVLSGHSLGCDRIVTASLHHGWEFPLVLLAPCDSYELQRNLIAPEAIESQRRRLSAASSDPGSGPTTQFDWLPLGEYGVRSTKDWTYPNPITRRAFLSISCGAPYQLFRYDQDPSWRLDGRALVVSPREDALLTAPVEQVGRFFSQAIGRCTHSVVPGDHMFAGSEELLAGAVIEWLTAE